MHSGTTVSKYCRCADQRHTGIYAYKEQAGVVRGAALSFIIHQDGNVYTFTIVLPYDPSLNKRSRYSPNME